MVAQTTSKIENDYSHFVEGFISTVATYYLEGVGSSASRQGRGEVD